MASSAQPMTNKPVHSCTYCGLLLSSANALMEHKRIHTGDRPFSCHVCNKRFTQKAHLNIHKRTHTGEKPYACHICHKRFAQSSHLSSHKRIHTGEKPFVCGICHIGFTQKQRLDAHLKKHMERPGQEIVVRQRLVTNASQYRKISASIDNEGFKLTIGQGISSIKSNSDSLSSCKTKTVAVSDGQLSPRTIVKNEPLDAPDDSTDMNGIENSMPDSGNDPETSAQSFSSEGMFLHPSGYVAFGRADDEDEALGSTATSAANHSRRRKPTVVRKHCSEPAAKQGFSAGIQKRANEEGRGNLEEAEVDAILGSNVVPTHMGDKSYNNTTLATQRVNTRSSNRKVVKQSLGKAQLASASDSSHSPHGKAHEPNPTDLAQVNNRISLVNFTAEELVAHMMKREDVNKCPFCCLIFQDAAMYHIHRNMHDKAELARCNTCGKLLQDKYDFTAHFLSTHQG